MGNLINKTIGEFKVQAFYQGKFMDVTREDTLGTGLYFFSTRLILPLCVPRS